MLAREIKVGDGIRYFDKEARNGNGILVKKWNLIIPKEIDKGKYNMVGQVL